MDDTSQPDTNTPTPDSGETLKFYFPYRPANFLCCALIIGTASCIIGGFLVPWHSAFFTLTTYAPTIHLAVQCIVQTSRGSYEMAGSNKLGQKAAILTVIWMLTIIAHVYFWWNDGGWFAAYFLLLMIPGSQATILLLYIALRSAWDMRMTRSPELPSAHFEDEATPHGTDTESQPLLQSDSRLDIYRPSKTLLVVSMTAALGSWGAETLDLMWGLERRNQAWAFVLLWPYSFLIMLQLSTLCRSLRRYEPTLSDEGGIGNHSIDLAAIFITFKPLIMICGVAPFQYRRRLYIPGAIQACLSAYIAARYMWSFSKVVPYFAQAISLTGENTRDAAECSVPDAHQPPEARAYHPLFVTPLTWLILSARCIYIEAPKELAIGPLMTVLVYIPTIVFCMYLLRPRGAHAIDSAGHRNAADWALHLVCLWIVSHLLSMYIAIRFSSWRIGSQEGGISQPQPDVEDCLDPDHNINPADVSNADVEAMDFAQPPPAESSTHPATQTDK